MKIVIAGGRGHIGTMLAVHWTRAGHEVIVLTRSTAHPARESAPLPKHGANLELHVDRSEPPSPPCGRRTQVEDREIPKGGSLAGERSPASAASRSHWRTSQRPTGAGGLKETRPCLWRERQWDGATPGPWVEAFEGADVCVNLAGRSVDCRYNAANRKEIIDSRVRSTAVLNQVFSGMMAPPRVWLNASTATIYSHSLTRDMDEASGEIAVADPRLPDTWNFSTGVARAWEEALFAPCLSRTRKVALRTSLFFSPQRGSVFEVFSRLVRLGLGGAQGNGKQYVSWIHESDYARALDLLIAREDISGPVNVTAPHPLPNREFMRLLRKAWGMPLGIPAPAWVIESAALLLRTESELVLKSRRVVPQRLQQAGFQFEYPDWEAAAADLVRRWRDKVMEQPRE